MTSKELHIKKRVLVWFSLAMLLLLSVVGISGYVPQADELKRDLLIQTEKSRRMFEHELKHEANLINGLMDFIKYDKTMQSYYLNRDRSALLNYALGVFEEIREKHRITHFYFHDTDGTNFLRVHNPARYGDNIDRFTLKGAINKQAPCHGIELGPYGTFTLRVVHPWRQGEQIIGYLELSKEIEHIHFHSEDMLGSDIVFIIRKKYISFGAWQEGLKMTGRTGDWNQFANMVIVHSTMPEIPADLEKYLDESVSYDDDNLPGAFEAHREDRIYYCGFSPLLDAGGRNVGIIVVLNNVTPKKASLKTLLITILTSFIGVGMVLFIFLNTFLGRMERELETARGDLENKIKVQEETEEYLRRANIEVEKISHHLQTVIDGIPNPILVIDRNYEIVLANKIAKSGMDDSDNVPANMTCYQLNHQGITPCESENEPCPIKKVLETGTSFKVTHVHRDGDGNERVLDVIVTPIFDEKGEIQQVIQSCYDVTERVADHEALIQAKENSERANDKIKAQLAELAQARRAALSMMEDSEKSKIELHRAKVELERINIQLKRSMKQASLMAREATQANKAKSEFLANMSHEIRTPMSAIIGFSDMLVQEELNDQQKEHIHIVRDSAQNLLTIINDILDFSKIEAGKLDIEIIECSLEKLLNSIASMLRPAAAQKGLDFKVLHKTKLPSYIRTDPTRLLQCLTNLVNNAIKFTEKGHVHVITSLEQRGHKSFVRFDVEDTGMGIAPEKHEVIFEAFAQADNTTSRKHGGTGLGLAITRRIVAILGGEITLKSEPGQGSAFSIAIPTRVNVAARPLLGEEKLKEYTGSTTRTKVDVFIGRILAAEDNPANQMLIKALMGKMGLDLLIVEDGQQAVEAALNQTFDLIFMDMQMPNMNGYEATRIMRQNGLTTPIVALTANAMKDDLKKCLSAGCDDYLSKPVDRKKLNQVMRKYLSSPQESSGDDGVGATSDSSEPEKSASAPSESVPDAHEQKKTPIDWATLMEVCGDEETILEITQAFCGDAPPSLEKIVTAVRDMDFANLELYAHRIKGASVTIGAEVVSDKAAQLEQAGKDKDSEAAQALVAQFQTEIDALLQFLAEPDWIEKTKAQSESAPTCEA